MKGRNIVVVGTSAGGLEALDALVGRLAAPLAATIFVVQHLPPEGSSAPLMARLARHTSFPSALAQDGERFLRGRIYVAPPDHHLLVKKTTLLVTKGARENRSRPGIDPLFRSAAVNHGARAIGVVLTGMLDDGTAGLMAIAKCGGVTVVQDPGEATYPGMAESALANLDVDHCVRIADMAPLLERLIREQPTRGRAVPEDVKTEAIIAERVLSDVQAVSGLGDLVPYNCPNCGGVLWDMKDADTQRFRCHTGHSFTAGALLTSQTEKIEETLWIALRMFEERRNLLNTMAGNGRGRGTSMQARAEEARVHIERIRAILLAPSLEEATPGAEKPRPRAVRARKGKVSRSGTMRETSGRSIARARSSGR